jgi:hypothetical protein
MANVKLDRHERMCQLCGKLVNVNDDLILLASAKITGRSCKGCYVDEDQVRLNFTKNTFRSLFHKDCITKNLILNKLINYYEK